MYCAVWIDNLLWLRKLLKFCVVGTDSEAYSSEIAFERLQKKMPRIREN